MEKHLLSSVYCSVVSNGWACCLLAIPFVAGKKKNICITNSHLYNVVDKHHKSTKKCIPQLIRAGHDRHPNVGVGVVFQDMVGMLLGQNLPRRLSYTSSSRVLVAAWLVFALILGVAYRGNLTASLTLPKYPPRPETLKEIVDSVDIITIPSYGKHFRKYYSDSESPLFQALGNLLNPGPSLMEGLKMALVKRSGHLDARKYIQYQILDKFTEKDGSTPLYVARGSVSPTPSGWPIPHDAPYKAHLDGLIVATLEVNLVDYFKS
ncbi:uncharacterized protein LOC135114471 [Scylla paramamosain]|uniref:uncharacterized protein LOC135114471 n=1 Tax=Scylla paramamosain TaxID=85552 RepID=UPI0030837777